MQNYRNLVAWRKAHALAIAGYSAVRRFPPEERYGLGAQLRRALSSITANIAEGSSRRGDRAFAAYLDIASGSAAEVETLLLLAADVGLIARDEHAALDRAVRDVRQLLSRLRAVVSAGMTLNRRR